MEGDGSLAIGVPKGPLGRKKVFFFLLLKDLFKILFYPLPHFRTVLHISTCDFHTNEIISS